MFATYVSSVSRTLFVCSKGLAGTPVAMDYLSAAYGTRRPIPEDMKGYDPKRLDSMNEMLSKYEYNFNHHLRLLLDALDYYAATETVALSRLCAVLGSALPGGGDRGRGDF